MFSVKAIWKARHARPGVARAQSSESSPVLVGRQLWTPAPAVRVELVDGRGTWVTFVPLEQLDSVGAINAAGQAFARFIANLSRDAAVLDERWKAAS